MTGTQLAVSDEVVFLDKGHGTYFVGKHEIEVIKND